MKQNCKSALEQRSAELLVLASTSPCTENPNHNLVPAVVPQVGGQANWQIDRRMHGERTEN
jgi:hypothetical protein